MRVCEKCGGLAATEPMEMISGTPCRCHAAPDEVIPEREQRHAARVEYHTKLRQQSKARVEQENAAMAKVETKTISTLLPDGGYFTVTWPETIGPRSVELCEKLFKMQWEDVKQWVAEREKEIDAAIPPPAADK